MLISVNLFYYARKKPAMSDTRGIELFKNQILGTTNVIYTVQKSLYKGY